MNENLLISCLLLVSVLTLIIWFFLNKWLEDRENEFVIYFKILTIIIDLYKETILDVKITTLSSQYDLNEKSKTNSLHAFEKVKNELISESIKDIMKNYLSKKCLKILTDRYGINGLSLIILTQLKR